MAMTTWEPAYIALHESGELQDRVEQACERLRSCHLCPRGCGIDRERGVPGYCRAGVMPRISSYGPHYGEEPPLVGTGGSGTIFFSYCTMRCEFCQNYQISHLAVGEDVSCTALAGMMINLQGRGCHNINFVTPTHFVPQILKATSIAASMGLHIPLVYNTGGYDTVETLRLLDGVFDVYMPDAKYGDDEIARALSHAPHYVDAMQRSLREMHRQVGDLIVEDGIAVKGLIIRHLVLPGNLARTEKVMEFIANEISKDSYVNIMDQYYPAWNVAQGKVPPEFASLQRPITGEEYRYALHCARKNGLHRGFPSLF
jgi:putative pyruvate formate lyase activating enzyme